MSILGNFKNSLLKPGQRRRRKSWLSSESLEERIVLTASPMPVLMVIADQQDFYYQEYGDTRSSLEAQGLDVVVAATTTQTSIPHANSGQEWGTSGAVTPDIALADVNADDYSAIVFVGGWGSSMYQYAFPGDYNNDRYDGDLATKQIVNDLINEFHADGKTLGFICHATMIGAWSRVEGESLFAGRQVSIPYVGSPAVLYNDVWYANASLGQYEQATSNGATANTYSGQYGDPTTATDDVIVDGNIITAENWDSARMFGAVIAQTVINAATPTPDPNAAPVANDAFWQLDENTTVGTVVGNVVASDPDVGQSLTYAIVGGNTDGAFAIDAATGEITVANSTALDFETNAVFNLQVEVTDNGDGPLGDLAQVTIELNDLNEAPPASVYLSGNDLIVQGTDGADTIYIWTGQNPQHVYAWMNGVFYGGFNVGETGRAVVYAGDGNDQVYATDSAARVALFGEGGHDRLTGGSNSDLLDGGDGVDVIWGNAGDDLIRGGAMYDYLFGREGNDILIGDDGNDYLEGGAGNDVLIGGRGADCIHGDDGDDVIISGFTVFDNDDAALREISSRLNAPVSIQDRLSALTTNNGDGIFLAAGQTVHDDLTAERSIGNAGSDLFFLGHDDYGYSDEEDIFAA